MTPLLQRGCRSAGLPANLLWLLLVLLSAASPRSAAAQTVLPADEPLPRSPLEVLVESRGALGLSSTQLDELDRIRERLSMTNEPLVARMMSLRDDWQQERRTARRGGRRPEGARVARIRAEAAAVRTRIQQNNREAMRTVNRLLSPPQRRELRRLIAARRPIGAGRIGGALDAGAGD